MYIIDSKSLNNYVNLLFTMAQFSQTVKKMLHTLIQINCQGRGGGGVAGYICLSKDGGSLLNEFNEFEF